MMGLFSTILVDGGGTVPRPLRWLASAARHPRRFVRSHSVRRWAERTVMLLVMQARDNSVRVRWTGRRLLTERDGRPSTPTWIPEANEAARIAADVMGGLPGSALNEVLLSRPFTAHILGGAPIGDSPEDGVLDALAARLDGTGAARRRRRRGQREPRRQPVADDRRAGGARLCVLAEPRRGGSTPAAWRALRADRAGRSAGAGSPPPAEQAAR